MGGEVGGGGRRRVIPRLSSQPLCARRGARGKRATLRGRRLARLASIAGGCVGAGAGRGRGLNHLANRPRNIPEPNRSGYANALLLTMVGHADPGGFELCLAQRASLDAAPLRSRSADPPAETSDAKQGGRRSPPADAHQVGRLVKRPRAETALGDGHPEARLHAPGRRAERPGSPGAASCSPGASAESPPGETPQRAEPPRPREGRGAWGSTAPHRATPGPATLTVHETGAGPTCTAPALHPVAESGIATRPRCSRRVAPLPH